MFSRKMIALLSEGVADNRGTLFHTHTKPHRILLFSLPLTLILSSPLGILLTLFEILPHLRIYF